MDKTILVKPNFNSADPPPGSTHIDTLNTLIAFIQSRVAKRIIVGEVIGASVNKGGEVKETLPWMDLGWSYAG